MVISRKIKKLSKIIYNIPQEAGNQVSIRQYCCAVPFSCFPHMKDFVIHMRHTSQFKSPLTLLFLDFSKFHILSVMQVSFQICIINFNFHGLWRENQCHLSMFISHYHGNPSSDCHNYFLLFDYSFNIACLLGAH